MIKINQGLSISRKLVCLLARLWAKWIQTSQRKNFNKCSKIPLRLLKSASVTSIGSKIFLRIGLIEDKSFIGYDSSNGSGNNDAIRVALVEASGLL